jgi:capsular exopolysaccharide synthesis family protein
LRLEDLLARCSKTAWNPDQQRMLFLDPDRHYDLGMEEFRTLRSRLYQIREKRPLKTVLIASAMSTEGKSFVAANLAQVFTRQHGRRALLIDADLRCSRLHLALGTPSTPGLADYLCGEVDELSIVQKGPMDTFFFIPGGKNVTNPAELIANGRLKQLLNRLSPVFDWIVIDTPPVVPVTDASLMGALCDGVLLVVHAAVTPLEMAQRARQEFVGKPLLGVVLNGVEPKATYSSYYYNTYGQRPGKEAEG